MSSCADAITDVVHQSIEYFIPFADDVPIGNKVCPWFNAECGQAEDGKHSPYLIWADARSRKAPDVSLKKRSFNQAAKSYEKALLPARLDRIFRYIS